MKLFTLLLLIAVLSNGFAQDPPRGFYKGTLTYADGKTEEGYIKCPFDHDEKKIKFIPLKGEDAVKVNSDELKSLTFTTEKSSYQFNRLRALIYKKDVFKKMFWFYFDAEISCPALSCYIKGKSFDIDRQGKMTLTNQIARPNFEVEKTYRSTPGGTPVRPTPNYKVENIYIDYYLKKPNEENANLVGGKMGNKNWKLIFQDDPEILKRMGEGKYGPVKGNRKVNKTMDKETKKLTGNDAVKVLAKDYCELHKEK
ncbi:MAG: hypothetical protein CRN43_03710 [Candidatus Nephrothrix sp. EaCA]|nr:MAG: hypothetical protein CRN43_03710 [Candidatus Nephrothrix sp. EaCA]